MSDSAAPGSGERLGVGAIVGDAFGLMFKNFLGMLVLFLFPIIVMVVLVLIAGEFLEEAVSALMFGAGAGDVSMTSVYLGLAIIYFVIMVLFCFFWAGGLKLIFDTKSSGRGRIGTAFGAGLSSCVRLALMSTVLLIPFAILYYLMVFRFLAPFAVEAAFTGGSMAVPIVLGILVLVFFMYLGAIFSPFTGTVVVEKMWLNSFGRSVWLSKDYRWPIVGILAIMMVFSILVNLIVNALNENVLIPAAMRGDSLTPILLGIFFLLLVLVLYGVFIAAYALIYARLREIKEGTTYESISEIFS